MEPSDFYSDLKHCPKCDKYVTYLMGVEHSYCTQCGGRVRLFSQTDWNSFSENLTRNRPKGGRPRKEQRGRESA